ncbi:hypothetical protein MMC27_003641 [Xylographa pallens]|nr:hypothetical protein [Xylographa pallens]
MPTRAFLERKLRYLQPDIISQLYICSSCLSKRAFWTTASRAHYKNRSLDVYQRSHPLKRYIASVTSVTAVNVTRTIPKHNRRLHEELTVFENKAATFANVSQLQLALRGLESDDPTIRVAVVGLNGLRGAKRLVGAVLADPLNTERLWERHLKDEEPRDTRALLVRYGEEYDFEQRHPLLRTLSIPSAILERHRIEILIHGFGNRQNEGKVTTGIASQNLLVPTLETPSSASGRIATVTYPVHKALIYGEDIEGILGMPSVVYFGNTEELGVLVKGAVNVHWESIGSGDRPITLINLGQSEAAIASFRKTLDNSIDYEHKWLASNVSSISNFIISGTSPTDSNALKPALKSLILSILNDTSTAISNSKSDRLALTASSTVPDSTRIPLSQALTRWAEDAHTELRDQLSFAFSGTTWRKLAWWKLLWRVDDVGFIASDILQRSFLANAEKELIWIDGRIQQAGLYPASTVPNGLAMRPANTVPRIGTKPPALRLKDVLSASYGEQFQQLKFDKPNRHVQQIGLTRADLVLSVPTLQALAQKLLLQLLSTTFLTTTLSSLLYISLSTTSIYEAGAIGILGFVWSARRLQRMWESAREAWVERVREEGRRTLGTVQASYEGTLREGGIAVADQAAEEEEKIAEEAVARLRAILDSLYDNEKV